MKMQLSALDRNMMLIRLEELINFVKMMPCLQPCEQCKHHDNGLCKHWDGIEIPPDVKPKGCDDFEFNPDTVPF